MATTAKERARLETEARSALSGDERRAERRALWEQRCLSLWAPATVFGAGFVLYIVLVEFKTAAYEPVLPIMRGFGLLMLAWFAVLLVSPFVLPRLYRLKKTRHEARERQTEVEGLLARVGSNLDAHLRQKLEDQLAALSRAVLTRDPAKIEADANKLSDLADKHLSAWRRNSVLDFVIGFGKAFAVAMLIRAIIIEPFKIPSGSMIPTLEIGDQIFVNKFIYGVRVPYANWVPFQIVRPPQRGDVIVFNNPRNTANDFIKRVIGVPGDRIKIVEEIVYINGQPQPREEKDPHYAYWIQSPEGGPWTQKTELAYQENLSGHPHITLQEPGTCPEGFGGLGKCTYMGGQEFVVPEKNVFVMGDHRDQSADGRYDLGESGGPKLAFVPFGNIKGKAMVIWLSLSHDGLFSSIFGGTGFRADRLFKPVR